MWRRDECFAAGEPAKALAMYSAAITIISRSFFIMLASLS
jgi:hypothetical protein